MARCTTCGNDYEGAFEVILPDGRSGTFDSFECAIQELAPVCAGCGLRIIGHGVQADAELYCSAHCARARGVSGLETHLRMH